MSSFILEFYIDFLPDSARIMPCKINSGFFLTDKTVSFRHTARMLCGFFYLQNLLYL